MSRSNHQACIEFGTRLRLLRTEQGYSQEGFAHKVDLHRTYIGGLERGERNPTLLVIVQLAKALDVPASKLLLGVGKK